MNWKFTLPLFCLTLVTRAGGPTAAGDLLPNDGGMRIGLRIADEQSRLVPIPSGKAGARLSSHGELVLHFSNLSTNMQKVRYHLERSVFLDLVDEAGAKVAKTKRGVENTGQQILAPQTRSASIRSPLFWPGEKWGFGVGRWDSLFELTPGKKYELRFRFMYWSFKEHKFVLSDELKLPVVFEEPSPPPRANRSG